MTSFFMTYTAWRCLVALFRCHPPRDERVSAMLRGCASGAAVVAVRACTTVGVWISVILIRAKQHGDGGFVTNA